MSERLLDAKEVAARLNVPTSWVREQARANAMPCLRLGRYVRFEWDAVEVWLEQQRVGQWRKHRPRVALDTPPSDGPDDSVLTSVRSY